MPLKHVARKRFGQHFLTDAGIIAAIVHAIAPTTGDQVLEIGPGLMALTSPLLAHLGRMSVVELDRDLAARLRANPGLQVIEADVLNVDFSQLALVSDAPASPAVALSSSGVQTAKPPLWRVVGNLPYNISSPILFHLCQFTDHVIDQHFMLQKEVVERMLARPKTAAYGRLSVMLQCRYDMEHVLDVPPDAFDPPPRVMSAVIRMVPLRGQALVDLEPLLPLLEDLVRAAFSQRRKLLRHSLGVWLAAKNFSHSFDLQRRAEEVAVAEYLSLCQALYAHQVEAAAAASQ
jgi:16S rRNA (adenine1518-N6/adenine1519-N6)-dimethyltransferase